MNDYLRRKSVIAILAQYLQDDDFAKVCDAIKELPKEDVLPVIRCKDCVHASPHGNAQEIQMNSHKVDRNYDEYITKAQAIELMHFYSDEACSSIIVELEALPAAEVAPVVHAQWVHEDVDWVCSNCGGDAMTEGDYRQVRSNYCPHCGVKMVGENNACLENKCYRPKCSARLDGGKIMDKYINKEDIIATFPQDLLVEDSEQSENLVYTNWQELTENRSLVGLFRKTSFGELFVIIEDPSNRDEAIMVYQSGGFDNVASMWKEEYLDYDDLVSDYIVELYEDVICFGQLDDGYGKLVYSA